MRYRPLTTVPAGNRPSSTLVDEDDACGEGVTVAASTGAQQTGQTRHPSSTARPHLAHTLVTGVGMGR
jgi:hypothetical protein